MTNRINPFQMVIRTVLICIFISLANKVKLSIAAIFCKHIISLRNKQITNIVQVVNR